MNKYRKKIHKISTLLSLIIVIIGIIRTIIMWNILPNDIGVHFDSDGTFDVIVNKKEWLALFYPYIVSLLIIFISEFLFYILEKVKVGLKINKENEDKIKLLTEIFIDIFIKSIWIFFLSIIWSDCVIRQHYLNTTIPVILFYTQGLSIIVLIIYIVVINIKNKK